mmetsp:Transcript_12247/g.17601  ORF Transcript_12247/g.17601 Transcript_12247/m.17601 type:complete len:100 (+) Transcript_12247:599-898(+)
MVNHRKFDEKIARIPLRAFPNPNHTNILNLHNDIFFKAVPGGNQAKREEGITHENTVIIPSTSYSSSSSIRTNSPKVGISKRPNKFSHVLGKNALLDIN